MAKISYTRREKGKMPVSAGVRLLSTAELEIVKKVFSNKSGLKHEQFAINPFGLPAIPIPEVRKTSHVIRLAPRNVNVGFLGHPIYWIHPELTKFREGMETREQWSVRMFYLIDAFGYWDKDAMWIDFLDVHEFSRDENAIATYHIQSNPPCETDNYDLLDETDLDISLDEAEENYTIVMERCFDLVRNEFRHFQQSQLKAYKAALAILGDRVWDHTLDFADIDGYWHDTFRQRLDALAVEYNIRAEEKDELRESGDTTLSDLTEGFYDIYDDLAQVLTVINQASSILNIPVAASAPGADLRNHMSLVSTLLMLSSRSDNVRAVSAKKIEPIIRECINDREMHIGGTDDILSAMAETYGEAWRRLRLAFINYNVVRDGSPPYSTYIEMKNALVAASQGLENVSRQFYNNMLNEGLTSD